MTTAEQLSTALLEADAAGVPIVPLTETRPEMTLAEAYEVQAHGLRTRLSGGATLVGHKVGLTSLAMQEMLGVDQPDFGYLTEAMVSPSGVELLATDFIAPKVEAEIAFRLDRPLRGSDVTVEEVMAATGAVAPALEIIDSRVADWRIKIADTIADNASCGHVVIGEWVPVDGIDLKAVEATLVVEGEDAAETVEGRGDAVLGDPALAVTWLARALDEYGGTGLVAGESVLPGAMARALPVGAGSVAKATMPGLGEVSVRFGKGQ